MSRKEIEQIIRAYFSDKPVIRAYLFGSYSINEQDKDSDVDVLVELDYERGGGFFKLSEDDG
jgi:predicted nucleotidyltransferase